MIEIIASGQVIDWILALVAVEALALALFHRLTGCGVPLADLWANLASGACLLLALKAAMNDAPWIWIAAPLAASLFAHLLDLSRRWTARSVICATQNADVRNIADQRLNADFGKNL